MRRALGAALAAGLWTLASVAGATAQQIQATPLEPPPQLAPESVPRGWPPPPPVRAESYLLVDAGTGQVLAQHEADLRRPVASTIKILTALSALRRAAPDEVVTVGPEIHGIGGASVGLREGDQVTVAQLLEAVVARSGNEATVALAHHTAGSVEAFLEHMRRDAADLGLDGLRLVTPSGLEDRNLVSARDLAVITRAAMQDPAFRAVAARSAVTLPRIGTVASRNELLTTYPGATGVKTGFTSIAGYSVVGSAQRDGRELIAVVLDAASDEARFQDAATLLDHGFEAFAPVETDLDVRLRVPGRWIETAAALPPLVVPLDRPATHSTVLPVEADHEGSVELAWNQVPLATADLVPEDAGQVAGQDGGATGRWLWGRAYAALRAAATELG